MASETGRSVPHRKQPWRRGASGGTESPGSQAGLDSGGPRRTGSQAGTAEGRLPLRDPSWGRGEGGGHKPVDLGAAYGTHGAVPAAGPSLRSPAVGVRQLRPQGLGGTGPYPGGDPSRLAPTG